MKRTLYLFVILAFVTSCALRKGEPTHSLSKEAWEWQTVLRLSSFQPYRWTRKARVEKGERYGDPQVEYGIQNQGLIKFAEGGWLYVITHSSHAEDSIGDVSLAIDHGGNIYRNEGHVCGGIWFECREKEPPRTVDEFIKTSVSWMDEAKWEKVDDPDPPPLSKKIQKLLDSGDYEAVLKLMPEVKKGWAREQAAVKALREVGATVRIERIGPARLIVALPERYGRYFNRAVDISSYRNTKITDELLKRVGRFAELQSLDLSYSSIKGRGFQGLTSLTKLRFLSVAGTQIDETSLENIGRMTSLRLIRVNETSINDETLQLLAPLENVQQIWAFKTTITEDGARRLMRVRPGVKIFLVSGQAVPRQE